MGEKGAGVLFSLSRSAVDGSRAVGSVGTCVWGNEDGVDMSLRAKYTVTVSDSSCSMSNQSLPHQHICT